MKRNHSTVVGSRTRRKTYANKKDVFPLRNTPEKPMMKDVTEDTEVLKTETADAVGDRRWSSFMEQFRRRFQ